MQSRFNIGDIIVCLYDKDIPKSNCPQIKKGNIYIVKAVRESRGIPLASFVPFFLKSKFTILLESYEIGSDGMRYWFHEKRFDFLSPKRIIDRIKKRIKNIKKVIKHERRSFPGKISPT